MVEVVLADRALLLARLRALAVLGANTRRPLPLAGVHDGHDPGGANVVQQFIRITFPLLSPYTFFLLIQNITYAFYGIFGAVDILTQGGPRGSTAVLIYKLYQDAFEYTNKTGSAASQSIILFLLVALLTIIQFRYVEGRVTYGE